MPTASRRPNGEQIGPKGAPGRLVAFPRGFRSEMEAIWTSRRDLIKMAHCFVEKSRNIDIYLRLLSSHWAILLQTSTTLGLCTDPYSPTRHSRSICRASAALADGKEAVKGKSGSVRWNIGG